MKAIYIFACCAFILLISACGPDLPPVESYSDDIRLNQVGYYPLAKKKAIVVSEEATEFYLLAKEEMKVIYHQSLSEIREWALAGEKVRVADFSDVKREGEFLLYVPGVGYSHAFEIKNGLYQSALEGSVRALFYQRAGMEISEEHGGNWHRASGHPDDRVAFHPSTGKHGFKASPKGWYDAGDFGKYVVNGAYPLGQLLHLAERYPTLFGDERLNLPESNNGKDDFLDELKYEMDWLLTMQDEDGGLFFKLTTERFEGMIMPEQATKPRFIIGKGTAPSLDFAATAAKAYRVFQSYDDAYAKACLAASKAAWQWARENPQVSFSNPEGIVTGEYGDSDFSQEFYWAAAELYISTGDSEYFNYLEDNPVSLDFKPGNSWSQHVHYVGALSLLYRAYEVDLRAEISRQWLEVADQLLDKVKINDYFQPIDDFHWGSNSDIANTAIILGHAYLESRNREYLYAALEVVDYLFGKNATGYSYVTGFGDKTPMFIHHRQSAADGIAEPVPGFLSGGPNSRMQDRNEVQYPDNPPPMKAWVDQEPSFASNEICLNWNAPLTYILGFLKWEMASLDQSPGK